jgi:hypothetical protein
MIPQIWIRRDVYIEKLLRFFSLDRHPVDCHKQLFHNVEHMSSDKYNWTDSLKRKCCQ